MKLTKSQLKQIIEEELKKVVEEIGGQGEETDLRKVRTTATAGRKAPRGRSKHQADPGIKPHERGLINALGQQLVDAAKEGNIVVGRAFQLALRLSDELVKLAPEATPLASALEAVPREKPARKAPEPPEPGGLPGAPPTAAALGGKA